MIKLTFGLAQMPVLVILSSLLKRREEREERNKTMECFPIILASTYYFLLIRCSPSWWTLEEGEGFCDFSSKHFAYQYDTSTVHQ